MSQTWATHPSQALLRARRARREAQPQHGPPPAGADQRPGHARASRSSRSWPRRCWPASPRPPSTSLHPLAPPLTPGHLLGTDQYGRDILARILYGGRIDLAIAFGATSVTLVFGTVVGLVAGYFGGWVDNLLMRIVDLFFAFPFLVLIIAIIAMLGPSIFNMFVAIWITSWVSYARIMRAQTVVAKKQQYVLAARTLGYGRVRVMLRHILPEHRVGRDHLLDGRRDRQHHPRRLARLPRPRRPAADTGVGDDDLRRPELHPVRPGGWPPCRAWRSSSSASRSA